MLITIDEFRRTRGFTKARAYEIVNTILPPGVVVRYGRQIRIDAEALRAFERAGGAGLQSRGAQRSAVSGPADSVAA